MVPILRKVERRVRNALSLRQVPPDALHIMHARTNGYGLLVRANEDVGRAIQFTHDFESVETRFFASRLQRNSISIDIGANVGYFTMLMAKHAPDGMVHAFEPLPLNAALLRASALINGFDNIKLNQSAVGAECGEVTFAEASDSAYSSMIDTGRRAVEKRFTVPLTTLDAYVAAHGIGRIDVLKADVEGAEALVIDGAAGLLASPERRPRMMMIELYQPNLEVFGASVAGIIAKLKNFGYDAFVLTPDAALTPYVPDTPKPQYNIVFLPAGER